MNSVDDNGYNSKLANWYELLETMTVDELCALAARIDWILKRVAKHANREQLIELYRALARHTSMDV